MATVKRYKLCLLCLLLTSITCGLYSFLYYALSEQFNSLVAKFQYSIANTRFFDNDDLEYEHVHVVNFDPEKEDVLVFMHIQKTGGSHFGERLVKDLNSTHHCHCRKGIVVVANCDCLTKNKTPWLFSRFSTGWKCGVHPDWTELTECVDKWYSKRFTANSNRSYHYFTLLRHPVDRVISEWLNVRLGATWRKQYSMKCNGKPATAKEVPYCYNPSGNWQNVSLKDFLSCKHNVAFNRQTRMLANLSQINCYNTTNTTPAERDRIMLQSAKYNLVHLAFFGLTEFQNYTQWLFQFTFQLAFFRQFQQLKSTLSTQVSVTEEERKKIVEFNHLDVELYRFAKDVFFRRVKRIRTKQGLSMPV